MDCAKVGSLIRRLRTEKNLTQLQLAEILGISDRAVSKWETGRGAPDASLLPALAAALGTNADTLIKGELNPENPNGGNMKKAKYYYCPACGSLSLSTGGATLSCCGRTLEPLSPVKPDEEHSLTLEHVEDEWFISTQHPMTREHYISFTAFVTPDRIQLIKTYPEWNLEIRIPKRRGLLLWYCTEHGLFYKNI